MNYFTIKSSLFYLLEDNANSVGSMSLAIEAEKTK